MGLISDVVESFAAALDFVADGFRGFGRDSAANLQKMGGQFTSLGQALFTEDKDFGLRDTLGDLEAFLGFTVLAFTDPEQFGRELFAKWDRLLGVAMAQLNVEVSGPSVAPGEVGTDSLAAKLAAGQAGSQRRLSAALAAINFIVLSGNAISIAAEAASAGTVRSIAEAIQSWVWANGLGSFSPLAFQPQVTASINPYLTRFYNSRAQAQIPPVTDIIRFQLREVYLEDRREELVGTEDRPIFDALMREWGFDKFHADSYWGAHWQLPSVGQLNEMLFRGVIDRGTWERFIRFNDLEPTSIPRLADIIYNPYTRVDVRRMARVGILSDDELLQAYADLGFFAETAPDAEGRFRAQFKPNPDFTVDKAQALVIFTKVFNAIPILRQRFAKGWITPQEVLDGLRETGVPELKAREIFETIVKEEGPARTAPERELTRALITRAWKLRLVSFPQAIFLLNRLGWDTPEAELILRVQSEPDDALAFANTSLGARLGAAGALTPAFPPEEFEE